MSTNTKVVVITGASGGIGAGLVEGYRAAGFNVIATARTVAPSNDPGVLVVTGDIADEATAERVISEGIAKFGRIDSLVNNAGVFASKSFTDFTADDLAAGLGVNLAGFFHITQRAIAEMEKQGAGHVVTITTSLVDQPTASVPAALAVMTKGGLAAVTRGLAIEYAARGIRTNAVSPGYIKTSIHPVENHATLAGMLPLGRMGEVSDIVEAVLFLESATFITGEILHVDGGQSAGNWSH